MSARKRSLQLSWEKLRTGTIEVVDENAAQVGYKDDEWHPTTDWQRPSANCRSKKM